MSYQREFERRLQVALVGLGSHSYRNILPALHHLPVRLRALCDLDAALVRTTGEEYGVTSLYTNTAEMYGREKLDAVFICTGPVTHPQLAIEAFNAGLHVWMEKPPALLAAEVKQMLAHVGDRTAVVGFKKAFMPATAKVCELIDLGVCGALATISAEYPVALPDDGVTVLAERRVTDWLRNGVHPISFMVRVGGKVQAVTAFRGPAGGGAVILEYASGVTGVMHLGAWEGYSAATERYAVTGPHGAIIVDNCARVSLHRGIPFAYRETTSFAPSGTEHGSVTWEVQHRTATLENSALFVQGMAQEMSYFCDCVLTGRKPEAGSLAFALDVMRVYEAALLSRGERIDLAGGADL